MRLIPPFPPLRQEPRPLTQAEIEHGIKISLVEGVLASAFGLLVGGTFFNALVIEMGANARQLGLLASLGPLSTLFQLVIPRIRERAGSRRRLLLWLVIPGRALAWSAILIPTLLPRAWWLPVLLGSVLLRSLIGQLDNNVYQDWLADLIPIERRSSYWGLRHTLSGPVGIVVPFLIGWVLDRWRGFDGFRLLYLIALPLMLADVALFLYQDEPPRQQGAGAGSQNPLRTLQWRPFRDYLSFFGPWTLLQGALAPYTNYLMFKVYRLPYTLVSGLTVLATLASTLLYLAWSRVHDRYGVRRVYRFILPATSLVTGLWAFVDGRSYPLYLAIFLLTGALNAATMVGGFNLLMSVIPAANRHLFLSTNSMAMGAAGFLAPNLGAYLIDLLAAVKPPLLARPPVQQLFLPVSAISFALALSFDRVARGDPPSAHVQARGTPAGRRERTPAGDRLMTQAPPESMLSGERPLMHGNGD